jgi:hypothetical protein
VSPDSHCPPRLRGEGRQPPGNSQAPTLNAVDAVACRARSGRLDVSSDGQSHQVPPATSLMTGSGARHSRGLVGRRGRLCPSYMRVQSIEIRSGCCYASCGPERQCDQLQLKSLDPAALTDVPRRVTDRARHVVCPCPAPASACDRQAAISGDFPGSARELCSAVSNTTSSFIALKPHSASRALVRSFGACRRHLTGLTNIDPSRVVARKRVVTTNSVSMSLRPPAIGPISCSSRGDRSSGSSPSIKPMTAWVQPSSTPRAAPPAGAASSAGGPSGRPLCAPSSGGTGTPTQTTTSGNRRVALVGHGDTAGVGGQRDCETQRQLQPARAAISSPPVSPTTRG